MISPSGTHPPREPVSLELKPLSHDIARVSAGDLPAKGEFEMANWSDPRMAAPPHPATTAGRDVAFDAGLRKHMLSVYNYMTSGVLLTGIIALVFAESGAVWSLVDSARGGMTPLGWIVMLAPLGVVLAMSFGLNRLSTGAAQALYWAYAVLMGMSLSVIFLVYTNASIALTFFATSAAFASLSLYGYTTKKDLSGMGTFLLMGVVGLIVASLINLFWLNDTFSLAISAVGLLIFAGLTVYHTQMIKSIYFEVAGTAQQGKMAIFGALQLYIAFINMFLFLLRFLGSRE
jgi:FtsH-binding integral membrane protein